MGDNVHRFSDRSLILAAEWRLLRQLLSRYQEDLGRDLHWLGKESWESRERLAGYLTGRRTRLPAGLTDDLRQVSGLSTKLGAMLLHHRAQNAGLPLALPEAEVPPDLGLHAASVALWAFLCYRPVFDGVQEWLTVETRRPADEYLGEGTGAVPTLTMETRAAFERRARRHLTGGQAGRAPRFHWHPGADGIGILVDHGALSQAALPGAEAATGDLVPHLDTLLYESQTGHLRITGCAEVRRRVVRNAFAEVLLRRPGFFERPGALGLHALDPDLRAGASEAAPDSTEAAARVRELFLLEVPRVEEAEEAPARGLFGRGYLTAYLRRHLTRGGLPVEGTVADR